MDFKQAYKFPLQLDQFGQKVFTKDHEMAFDFVETEISKRPSLTINKEYQEDIVHILNGASIKPDSNFHYSFEEDAIFIHVFDVKLVFIVMRGWGHLTGVNGLRLPVDQAKQVQSYFAHFIISKLTSK